MSRVVRSMGSKLRHDRAKELKMLEVPDMATVARLRFSLRNSSESSRW